MKRDHYCLQEPAIPPVFPIDRLWSSGSHPRLHIRDTLGCIFFLMPKSGHHCRPIQPDFQRAEPASIRILKGSGASTAQPRLKTTAVWGCSGSQSVVPGSTVSASLRNVLEMQIFGSHPRPTESGTLQVGPSNLHFNKHSS